MRALQDVDNLIGRVVDDRYRVTERIGTGAMAAIYRAELLAPRPHEPKICALKIIRPEIIQNRTVSARFHREAKAASKLRHPGIVRIIGWGFEEDVPYIAMELIEGEDLFEVLEREGPLPQAWSVLTAMRICDALAVAHVAGVVHRDLKPENIMVTPPSDGGEHGVKVLDFGIAKLVGPVGFNDETVPQILTKVGSAVGTPSHMAPEQARGDEVDGRTDVYALGVLLYEMITGHLPFEGNNPLLVAIQQVRDKPPPPSKWLPNIHPQLEKLILQTLNKAPDERPQSAELLGLQLKMVFDELVVEHERKTRTSNAAPSSTSGEHLTGRAAPPSPPPSDDDDVHTAPTAITAVTRLSPDPASEQSADAPEVSDDDSIDTFTAETFTSEVEADPSTLKRDVRNVRRALDRRGSETLRGGISAPTAMPARSADSRETFDIEDEPTTLDDKTKTPRAPRPARRSRVIVERDHDADDGAPTKERRHDSEAPIATVVADPKPLVEMARELSRRAAAQRSPARDRMPEADSPAAPPAYFAGEPDGPPVPAPRAPMDSEAPVATVVTDPKPLVEMARELGRAAAAERQSRGRQKFDSEAPIATVVAASGPLIEAARQYETLKSGGGLRPGADTPLSGLPGTMRSSGAPPPSTGPSSRGIPPTENAVGMGTRPQPGRTLLSAGVEAAAPQGPLPPAFGMRPPAPGDTRTQPLPMSSAVMLPHHGYSGAAPPSSQPQNIGQLISEHVADSRPFSLHQQQPPALPPSEWPLPSAGGRNYQGELEEMLKEMPKGPPLLGTILVLVMVAMAICALAWVLFIY